MIIGIFDQFWDFTKKDSTHNEDKYMFETDNKYENDKIIEELTGHYNQTTSIK